MSEPLERIGQQIHDAYAKNRRVMSFQDYLRMALAAPARHARSSAQYISDVFQHYGTTQVDTPRGQVTRFGLFDCPFDGGRDALIGQEDTQLRLYRAIQNFVREGKTNRLVLLHGPNGSAKSTLLGCVARGMEHYSTLEEGPLYKFNWIFPMQKISRAGIGFGERGPADSPLDSYADLDDALIDARLPDELRDHPLLLLPLEHRREALAQAIREHAPGFQISDYLMHGDLGPRNRQIFEALLAAYKGDYLKVLRHVQVERFYVSRRYREAAVTIEPQQYVDARTRQITMERSFQALPSALQNMALFEYAGELVDANRGLIDYEDLLKRPLEAYKYLLVTVEHGTVALDNAILQVDEVFVGSSNEGHLAVFKEVPEFQSFKGRLELIRVPYLLDYKQEMRIYEEYTQTVVGRPVAPHVPYVAALWAVLTRMRKPLPEKYPKSLSDLVGKLGPLDKAELYARGVAPESFPPEQARELVSNIERLYAESDAYPNYEGRSGASPREMKTLILNAAQSPRYKCLSPLALFDEIEELCKNVTVYEFLKQEPLPGGYHEHRKFVHVVRERYLDLVDAEVRAATALVDETQYAQLFDRYVTNVLSWVRKEKVRNPVTDRLENPDEDLMGEVEKTLGGSGRKEDFRNDLMTRIGAWSIDHPNQRPVYAEIFGKLFEKLRESYFEKQKKVLRKTHVGLLVYLTDGPGSLDAETLEVVERTLGNLKDKFGYCQECAREVVGYLMRKRYSS